MSIARFFPFSFQKMGNGVTATDQMALNDKIGVEAQNIFDLALFIMLVQCALNMTR